MLKATGKLRNRGETVPASSTSSPVFFPLPFPISLEEPSEGSVSLNSFTVVSRGPVKQIPWKGGPRLRTESGAESCFFVFLGGGGVGRWAQSVFSPAKANDVLKAHPCLCFASTSGGQGPAQNGSVPQGEYIILLSVL